MAERRMFAKTIIDSDAFLDMPMSTQCLYFHLSMRADDDGFINAPKKIQRIVGASDDDLKLLIAKHFIIPFESGIVVIKHWKIHNYIRSDRYKETVYQEEKAMLNVKDNGSYTIGIPSDNQVVYQLDTQDRIGKDSKDNNSADADTLFEKLWSMYPKKRGKSSVKPATRKKLLDVGEEEMTRAVKRYAQECKGKDPQYIMNGSTFFNGRYEDYLGDDYTPMPQATIQKVNNRYVPEPPKYQKFTRDETPVEVVGMPQELRDKLARIG